MPKGRKLKGPKTLWDLVKEVDENFAMEIYSLTDDELKDKLVQFANESQLFEDKKSSDPDLKRISEERKSVSETYDLPLKEIKLKRKLAVQTLRERGKLSDLEK